MFTALSLLFEEFGNRDVGLVLSGRAHWFGVGWGLTVTSYIYTYYLPCIYFAEANPILNEPMI